MTIKTFAIEYDSINSKNIFTNGDTINGRIIVEVSKETKIQALIFIAKGKATVCWSEHYGQYHHHVYRSSEKYYEVTHHILREARQDGTEIIGKGRHVFPFSYTIPDRKIPSTFKGSIGKIVHKLKAELKQSMKLTKKAKTHFTFVSRADMDTPGLMEPQYGCKDKSVGVFGSGNVSIDVHTKRMGYTQGEGIQVIAEISNRSSRSVKPKFTLYEKRSFFAQGRRRVHTNEILKDKLEPIESSDKKTVTKVITIPRDLPPSILNCSIIKLEYRLKVYLDIKCASDPEIKLPIVVLPALEAPSHKQPPPSAGFGFEPFGNPNPAPWGMTPPLQVAPRPVDPPPPYGACAAPAMYPPVNQYGQYENKF
ncbi:arrestin domain-containing protein 3-like [Xyrichtys novacula]|uniref:Arrestin domain-containing protein 3-like n=1 Tax=Xyrichtys novacula TaxID=13765 RepID=A0AAV1G800_XYRNO|nr:arrestin domain-containing protein 3-like [Xyrichtys novacula]